MAAVSPVVEAVQKTFRLFFLNEEYASCEKVVKQQVFAKPSSLQVLPKLNLTWTRPGPRCHRSGDPGATGRGTQVIPKSVLQLAFFLHPQNM